MACSKPTRTAPDSMTVGFLVLLLALTPSAGQAPPPCHQVAPKATEIVDPILKTRLQANQNVSHDPATQELWAQLEKLEKDDSPSADEASVVLYNYYLGEANDEDMYCDLLRRGQRVLLLLRTYLKAPPCALTEKFKPLLHKEETRCLNLSEAIRAIEKGEEPPCD